MTSQRVERTWIHTGGYGQFRGEWVKNSKKQIEIVWLEINPFATATANVNVKHVSETNRF